MRKSFFFLLIFLSAKSFSQTIPTPADFLGYELGSRFTPHHRIVDYFKAVAGGSVSTMRLTEYGTTNENRPLLMAVISSAENVNQLEKIRENNLRLTGLLDGKSENVSTPVIVWLSYNVHGNEPSSSEASMLTLYELVSGKNTSVNEWLKNTVVIIDPCLNPDGRERYVNWITQMTGKEPNASASSREHDEPWPGGRYNHYYFDLNRDWAWQTQKESQLRLKLYQHWMPQIHCDFHEQGPEAPYYFAPAAEPMHEAITQWEKDFQVTVGKNHAKYFDRNGWLYFTKQYFDLFYPAYGDTYPLFNGSIGMTYEQGGGPRGGLSVALNNGDTLTLAERIAHHFTTGLSTIETAAENSTSLLSNFRKYFDDSRSAKNAKYKSYIVRAENVSNLNALKTLLEKNLIRYGYASDNKQVNAFNYFSGKKENISVQKNDLVISSAQPKSVLLNVLFEAGAKLHDSATYDITAWALPFAYGLQSFATTQAIAVQVSGQTEMLPTQLNSGYGYLVDKSSPSFSKFISDILQKDVRIRFNESTFSYRGKSYLPGTFIILVKGNESKMNDVLAAAKETKSTLIPITTGFMEGGIDFGSDKIHFLRKPRVALLTGPSVSQSASGEVWDYFDNNLNYPITLLNAERFDAGDLKETDVLIMPSGNYKFLMIKEGAAELKTWISAGGRLIVVENAAVQIAGLDWGLKIKKAPEDKGDSLSGYAALKKFGDREKDLVTNNIPGAVYKMQLDNSHPLAFGYPDFYYTLKLNEIVFEYVKDGWNIGYIKKQKPVDGFVGNRLSQNISDATLMGELPIGRGSVIFFADDPLFRGFWENGKMLFSNAVFFSGMNQ